MRSEKSRTALCGKASVGPQRRDKGVGDFSYRIGKEYHSAVLRQREKSVIYRLILS